ncbi:MAG: serine/threonine protein kinase, partial [Deltaproteobacteria bacterium]|nr:serine/threonine protein kinase [Deltaproteobacteria bacterium]
MSEAAARRLYCSRCLNTFEADHEQCPNLSCRRKRPTRGWGVIFAEGDIFDRNYRIHKMLAVGGAGVTYLGREIDANGEETGPRLAIKVLLAARDAGPYVRRLATEAQIIQELDHANIVQYLGFVHRAGHSPFLLTRFESGGSLLDHMRRVGTLSVRAACVVGRQICWALEKAHERGIVHRDLKPENVLLSRTVPAGEDPVVRVADFGIAKVQGSLNTNLTRVGAFVGTPHYAAPEQFVGGTVTEAADVYSVGALMYFCMTARHVARFADRLDPEEGFQLLCDSLPPVLERSGEDAATLTRMNAVLAVAMRVDPKQRCTVVELDRMLEAVAAGRDPELPVQPAPPPEVALAPPAAGLLPPPAPLSAGAVPPPGAAAAALTRSEPT